MRALVLAWHLVDGRSADHFHRRAAPLTAVTLRTLLAAAPLPCCLPDAAAPLLALPLLLLLLLVPPEVPRAGELAAALASLTGFMAASSLRYAYVCLLHRQCSVSVLMSDFKFSLRYGALEHDSIQQSGYEYEYVH